ncbi:MAG: SUMF1/EgtB/PvdO family nonheme iron enzyme [Victivallales bacterium]
MPDIIFTCPQCKSSLATDAAHLGQAATCPGCSASVVIPANVIYPGLEISGFVLEKPIGKGGMGEVWLAHHTAMERKVAFKILSPAHTNDPEFVGRFLREVRNSAKLEHPNIVTAFDAGVDKGFYFLAMTYVDGIDLETRISLNKSIPEEESLRIVRDMAKALDYAWNEFKLLHCDIKPANIMIDDRGKVRLMDLGLSKCISGDSSMTITVGGIMGTPHYISPEQARGGKNIDFRSDVYSLGATFYHIVTGYTPYSAENPMGIVTRHITDPLPPADRRNPAVSAPCSALIDIMMSKNPEDRGENWKEVIRNIDAAMAGKFPGKQVTIARIVSGTQTGGQRSSSGKTSSQSKSDYPKKSSGSSARVFTAIAVILIVVAVVFGMVLFKGKPSLQEALPAVQSSQPPVPDIKQDKTSPVKAVEAKPVRIATINPMAPAIEKKMDRKEIWDEVLAFAKDNTDDSEKVISKFREVKIKLAGSEYEALADRKIMEMVNAQLSKDAVVSPIADIPKYKVKETASPTKAKSDEAEKGKFNEFLDSIVLKLVNNKYEDALAEVKKVSDGSAYPNSVTALDKLRGNLESMLGIDKIVLESFTADIGKEVSIDTMDGMRKVIVREVKADRISIEEKKGVITAKMDLPARKLTETEKLRHAAKMPTEARNIYAGLIALGQYKDFAKAEESLKDSGELSEAFCKYMFQLQKEKADADSREEMIKLLGKAGLKGRSLNADEVKSELEAKNCPADKIEGVLSALEDYEAEKELSALLYGAGFKVAKANSDRLKAELAQKKMTASELEKLQKAITAYREKYRGTNFLRDKGQFLDTLLGEAGNTYGNQFEKPMLVPVLNMLFVPISAGEFKMGGAAQVQVKITKPFWIGKYEVTQMQYEKIMSKNPSAYKSFNAPVERVSWNDAQEFCRLLTEKERKKKSMPEGYVYRLPTEAEWEYCCRAGTDTVFSFGNPADEFFKYGNYCDKANTNKLGHQDRKHDDGCDKTSVVGKYQPNAWGICDMHGNVWEWCLDWYGDIKGKSLENPTGGKSGSSRVNRGGAWDEPSDKCTSSYRGFDSPESSYDNMGFRIVLAYELGTDIKKSMSAK